MNFDLFQKVEFEQASGEGAVRKGTQPHMKGGANCGWCCRPGTDWQDYPGLLVLFRSRSNFDYWEVSDSSVCLSFQNSRAWSCPKLLETKQFIKVLSFFRLSLKFKSTRLLVSSWSCATFDFQKVSFSVMLQNIGLVDQWDLEWLNFGFKQNVGSI